MVGIAAGMVHSMALTDDGTLFYWVSSDPDLKCQQVNIQYQRIWFLDTLVAHNICQYYHFFPVRFFCLPFAVIFLERKENCRHFCW